MTTWNELMKVYMSLVAHKKRLGNEMGRVEAKPSGQLTWK